MSLSSQRRDLLVKIAAETKAFDSPVQKSSAELRKMHAELRQVEKRLAKQHEAMDQVGKASLALGLAAAAGVGMAVKRFADFDAAISDVQAATHESTAAMGKLREAALDAGARTVFSATEAAGAIEQLAKAGVSTQHILAGGLNGALDLAAAGSLAVGEAAEIAATAMTQFELSGTTVPHIADLLAAAAGKAQGEVTDMGAALKQSGLVAAQTGLTIEETTAGLAAFASAGLLGSDAGTSFKAMLQRLTPTSTEAARLMDDLGISAYDAQGDFIGLEGFAGNLQSSLNGLTVELRNSALATIFGSDAVRAAAVLYKQGAAGVADWTAKVDDAGYAQETAAIKLDNLKGDVEAFLGSVETALIRSGSAGDAFARGGVQSATAVVNAYNDLPPAAQTAALGLTGVVGAAGTAAGGFLLLAPRITETRQALATLGETMPKTTSAMVGLGKASALAGVIFGTAVAIDALRTSMNDAPPKVGALTEGLADFVRNGKATGDLARLLGNDFTGLADKIDLANKTRYLSLEDYGFGGGSPIQEARDDIAALDEALVSLHQSGNAAAAEQVFAEWEGQAAAAGKGVEELQATFPGYTDAVASASAETKLAAGAQDELGGASVDAAGNVQSMTDAMTDQLDAVQELTDLVLGLRDANRGYEQALDAATETVRKNGRTLDISTEAGRANEAALDAIASSAAAVLDQMAASGASLDEMTAAMGRQREQLIKAAKNFGMTQEAAEAYADQVLRVPTKVTTAAIFDSLTAAKQIEAHLRALGRIPAKVTTEMFISEIRRDAVAAGRGPQGDGPGAGGPALQRVMPVLNRLGGYVTNTYRTPAENRRAGGSPTSYHLDRNNPAVDIGGPAAVLSRVHGALRAMGGWRELLWQVPGHYDHVHVADEGGVFQGPGYVYMGPGQETFASGLAARKVASLPPWNPSSMVTPSAAAQAALGAGGGPADLTGLLTQWDRHLDQLEQAARRQELLAAVRAGEADAAQRLLDFDLAAYRATEREAVEALIAVQERETEAREKDYERRREINDNLFELGRLSTRDHLINLDMRMAREERYSDEWTALYKQRQQVIEDVEEAQRDALSALNRLLDEQAEVQQRIAVSSARYAEQQTALAGQMAAAEAELYTARSAAARDFAVEQDRILGGRRDALASWARLDELSPTAWGNSLGQLLGNARSQMQQFTEWTAALADARRRGVSEAVIASLGLDEGPEALGQLRQFGLATQAEIDALNVAVGARAAVGAKQARAEQVGGYGQVARDLADAHAQYSQELASAQAEYRDAVARTQVELEELQVEFLAEQAELAAEFAGIGREQGRSYGAAVGLGVRSQLPAVRAAVVELQALLGQQAAMQQQLAAGAPPLTGSLIGGSTGWSNWGGLRDTTWKLFDTGGTLDPGPNLVWNGLGRTETLVRPELVARQVAGATLTVNINAPVYGVDALQQVVRSGVTQVLSEHRAAVNVAGARG